MSDYDRDRRSSASVPSVTSRSSGSPGKRTLVESRYGVQRKASAASSAPASTAEIAARGVDGPGERLPFLDVIQQSAARDLGSIEAHVGGPAADACAELGATAYATGNKVAFASSPDLHTATHEATHVLQQSAGVQLRGGVGQAGDEYERQADAAGDAIVAGRSIAHLMPAPSTLVNGGATGVQMQKDGGGGKPKPPPKGSTPLVVHVFHKGGKVTTWRGVTDLADLKGHAFYGGKGDGGAWSWNSDLGDMIDLYKDENDRTPTPVSALAAKKSVEFISIHIGALDMPVPDGKDVAELSGVSKKKAKKRTGPIDPDRALFGDDASGDDDTRAQADPAGVQGGQDGGVIGATGRRHRTGGGDQFTGDAGDTDSKGADADAILTGDSQGHRRDIIMDKSGAAVGRRTGPRGGKSGNTHDRGKAGGRRDGVDTENSSIVHNPNAEMGKGPGGNIPEDGGTRDGMAGGEKGGHRGGLPDGLGLWPKLEIEGGAAQAVALGMIFSDADLDGAAEKLIKEAAQQIAAKAAKRGVKRLSKAALTQLAKDEISALADDAMKMIERDIADHPEWLKLDETARNHLRARWRYELEDSAQRALERKLDIRLKEYDEAIQDGKEIGDEIGGDEFLRENIDQLKKEREPIKKAREALKDVEHPQGTSSYKQLDAGPGRGVELPNTKEWASIRSYWTEVTSFDGMKVYRRNDLFDPHLIVEGESNLERMARGRAPIGHDMEPVQIHHLNQANEGPVVEVSTTFHRDHSKTIHINSGTKIPSGVDRDSFDAWRERYWTHRSAELKIKPRALESKP